MLIKELSHLDNSLIKEIQELESICKDFDGLNGTIYLDTSFNFNKDMKSKFLMYEDKKLASFLSIFLPTSHEAEISAYTLPEYRRKGHFTMLLENAIKELKTYGVEDILFVCESKSEMAKEVTKELNAKYDFTEYSLRYSDIGNNSLDNHKYHSRLCTPKIEDIETIVHMSQRIFNEEYEDAKSMVQNTMESEERIQYAIIFENKYVGMGCASFAGDEVSIYGLGILPEYQGRGLGKELLFLILSDLAKKNCRNITLDVNSTNEKAFKLYRNNGFEVEISYDYYRKKIV